MSFIRLWTAFLLLRLAGVLTNMAARLAPGNMPRPMDVL